jgi:hypothetical protein
MKLTDLVTRVTLKRQEQEIDRQRQEMDVLRAELAWRKRSKGELEEGAARKLPLGINLNRYEAAAYLRTSPKTLQRWEKSGRITRCPGYGTSVIYAARDVLRLASASSRKGA